MAEKKRKSETIIGNGLDSASIAKGYIKEYYSDSSGIRTLIFWEGSWWQYDGLKYEPLGRPENWLKPHFLGFAQGVYDASAGNKAVSAKAIGDAFKHLEKECLVNPKIKPQSWLNEAEPRQDFNSIPFLNGILKLESALHWSIEPELKPHSPEFFSLYCLPYPFEPKAQCSLWISFLETIFEKDSERIALLQEIFGYLLTPDTSLEKYFLFEGSGRNGKGVVTNTLRSFLGETNVSAVDLRDLSRRFQLWSTYGKLANIATEVGDISENEEGKLKSFISGEEMQFEDKFKTPIVGKPTARLVFSTNNRPKVADSSHGIWRRLCLIPFDYTVPENAIDTSLSLKLKQELSGILNWSLQGLSRIRKNGKFTIGSAAKAAAEDYRFENDPFRQWIIGSYEDSDSIPPGKGSNLNGNTAENYAKAIPLSLIKADYETFCFQEGMGTAYPKPELLKRIKNCFQNARFSRGQELDKNGKIIANSRIDYVYGIKPKN